MDRTLFADNSMTRPDNLPVTGVKIGLYSENRILRYSFLIIMAIVLVSACTDQEKQYTEQNQPGAGKQQENTQQQKAETLEERVTAYWRARELGDVVTAYEYEDYKATGEVTLQQYARRGGGIIYKRIDVVDVIDNGDGRAIAKVDFEVEIVGLPDPLVDQFDDRWISIDGQWYHHSKRRALAEAKQRSEPKL